MTRLLQAARLAIAAAALVPALAAAEPRGGIAMYGDPALPPDFVSLPYADPDAPKGGTIVFGELGGFDSLNPYILKGQAPAAIQTHVFETLMARNWDEPFGLYGLLAETIDTGPNCEWVEFTLRPEARFSDGSPVTVEDVIWSMETLSEKGLPRYRNAWQKVAKVEQTGERSVRFAFSEPDAELPLIIGLRPILKKADWDGVDFAASSLRVPVGSGPYTIGAFEPGRAITFVRDPDYWGRELPINRGVNNFDTVRYEYFVDAGVLFQAFTARRALGLPRAEPEPLEERVRLPRRDLGQGRQGRDPAWPALGDGGLRLQHPAADLRGLAGAGRAGPRLQLRVRQPDAECRRLSTAGELFRQLRARHGHGAGDRAGGRAPRPLRRASSCRTRSTPMRCRSRTARRATGRTCASRRSG